MTKVHIRLKGFIFFTNWKQKVLLCYAKFDHSPNVKKNKKSEHIKVLCVICTDLYVIHIKINCIKASYVANYSFYMKCLYNNALQP